MEAPASPPFHALGHRVVALAGRDAIAFAQAQCMNDVAALGDGQWQWNGWLTPKGRLIALFALLRLDAQTLWLLLPDADPADIAARLQRFVFRSKVAIAVRDDLHVSGAFAAPHGASGAQFMTGPDGGIELDLGGDGGPRSLRIGAAPAEEDATTLTRWTAFELAHGLPRLQASEAEQWTPQQLSLERLRAYSVKKGCYPGQEIVARTHFLGQAKRGLALLQGAFDAQAGAEVMRDGQALGRVVSVASGDGIRTALAVLPIEREPGPLLLDGVPVVEAPLQGGLAR